MGALEWAVLISGVAAKFAVIVHVARRRPGRVPT